MNKFIRRNNKKLLAIAGVFLMITFVANTRYGGPGGNRGNEVIGTIGKDKVIESELEDSRQQWRLLKQALMVQDPKTGEYLPFLAYRFPPAQAIDQDPKLYLLLQEEAGRLGTGVTDQGILDFLAQERIDIQLPSGAITHFDQIQSVDPDYAIEVRQAIAGFLSIVQASNRAQDLCKISCPIENYFLAENDQKISVRLVGFDANKLNSKIPAPTTQELEQHFKDFADLEPSGTGSEKNPLGFGYKIPDEVRLQTISVSRRDLKDAVSKSKSDYDWDVLARGYYLKHKADYPSTQPTATQPSPTAKNFEQVRADVLEQVINPLVDDLSDRVQKSILATLSADWAAYHAAHPDTQPATNSASSDSSLGFAYNSYDYMKALAAKVQTEFNVLPETAAYNQPLSSSDLSKLSGIGHAHTAGGALSLEETATDPTLAVFQPSATLQDDASTFYLFRVTERIPAHPPASMAEVADAVKTDWVKSQAYETALKQATALRDAAVKTGLTTAAANARLIVDTTPPFSASLVKATEPVAGVPLAGEDVAIFKQKCESILESAAKQEPPVAMVEAPNESKVLVIELAEVQPDWPDGQRYVAEAAVSQELMSEFARPLTQQWFTLPAVEARLGYVDAQKDKSAG